MNKKQEAENVRNLIEMAEAKAYKRGYQKGYRAGRNYDLKLGFDNSVHDVDWIGQSRNSK